MISCAAAVYGIGRYRERQSVTLAGLFVGVVNAAMAIALLAYAEQPLTLNSILLALGLGFVGGLLTAIFAAGGLPINESLFGILTDVKLLELSNADLPVLGQLALRAPGTNQHSHAVGQLAEDASRAVGANPLLARIGALYHDIGKVAAPEYFVENQQGENPHDHMRPSQSARIITSHVTYGVKLAKEINLPKKIADFIPQHHGTRTLHFFLRKAQAEAKPGEVIDEKDFRYPGPKPQFKEAAIMMLADSCEAAARFASASRSGKHSFDRGENCRRGDHRWSAGRVRPDASGNYHHSGSHDQRPNRHLPCSDRLSGFQSSQPQRPAGQIARRRTRQRRARH